MATEEYGVLAGLAIGGIIVGFVLSKMLSGNKGHKSNMQRITPTEISRWKIDPEWATILCDGKAIENATKEYAKLMKLKAQNDEEDALLQAEARERLEEISAIKAELKSQKGTPLNVAYLRELGLAPAMAKLTRLRRKAQKIVAVDLRYAYHEHFLFLVKSGSKSTQV